MARTIFILSLTAALTVTGLVACGQTGELRLPDEPTNEDQARTAQTDE